MGKYRKRKEVGEEGKMVLSMKEVEEEDDGDEEDSVGINEEKIAEVMKWLEQEITTTSYDPYPYPYPPPVAPLPPPPSSSWTAHQNFSHYYHSSPFVTINGNEESCGPSFSDTSSTVMATFHTSNGPPSTSSTAVLGSDEGSIINTGSDMLFVTEMQEQEEDEWLASVIIGGSIQGLEEEMQL